MTRSLIISACIHLLAVVQTIHAEELTDFLKRTVSGNATMNDMAESFTIFVFVGEQMLQLDRDGLIQLQDKNKVIGGKTTLKGFTILSQTETPISDGAATLISVISEAQIVFKIGDSVLYGRSLCHDVILRGSDGKFRVLFSAARQ